MSYSYTVRFEPVTQRARKSVKCTGCGKRLQRRRTFEQTLSPYNKDRQTGQLKTREQIRVELLAEAREWEQKPETCTACAQAVSS